MTAAIATAIATNGLAIIKPNKAFTGTIAIFATVPIVSKAFITPNIPLATLKAANALARTTKVPFKTDVAVLLSLIFFKKSAIFFVVSDSLSANTAMLFAALSTLVAFFVVSVFIPRNEFMTFPVIETMESNALFMLSQASKKAEVAAFS